MGLGLKSAGQGCPKSKYNAFNILVFLCISIWQKSSFQLILLLDYNSLYAEQFTLSASSNSLMSSRWITKSINLTDLLIMQPFI